MVCPNCPHPTFARFCFTQNPLFSFILLVFVFDPLHHRFSFILLVFFASLHHRFLKQANWRLTFLNRIFGLWNWRQREIGECRLWICEKNQVSGYSSILFLNFTILFLKLLSDYNRFFCVVLRHKLGFLLGNSVN